MRWPFGPPHLTLKPSKTKNKNKKKQNKIKKKKNKKNKGKKQKNTKYQKRAFQLWVNFFFFGGCPKFPFLDNLDKKARTQKTL